MPGTVMPPARKQSRGVLNAEIGLQIDNVYEGLSGDNLALWNHPLTSMKEALKSAAIDISNLSGKLKQLARSGLELQATEKEWVDRGLVLNKTNRIRM
jgi:hypothetical protein